MFRVIVASLTLLIVLEGSVCARDVLVIAHRGASAYLPEHTLEAYVMAYAQGADYLEPDIVLTGDGVPIALHDRTLEATTNVAETFPGRARRDGRYYALDFTLAEIKQLSVRERVHPVTRLRVFRERFPNTHQELVFRVPTLAEIIELVQGLNSATGRWVGLYPETKASRWHGDQGYDLERSLLEVLDRYGLGSPEDPVFVQSFEPTSLQRLRALGSELELVQLIGSGSLYDGLTSPEGLDTVAGYADGIGLGLSRVVDGGGRLVEDNALVRDAQARGLVVHVYTLRADRLPPFASTFDELLELIVLEAGVDGVFTDHPDLVVRFLSVRTAVPVSGAS